MNSVNMKQELLESLSPLGRVETGASMESYTTFSCGGPADILVVPRSADGLPAIVGLVRESGLPVTVIGGGSNLLVGDRGIRGVVIAVREQEGFQGQIRHDEAGLVYADASVKKRRLIDWGVEQGLGGVEFMAGIPGCLGGGIMMNAGTFMGCFNDVLKRVDFINSRGRPCSVETDRAMSSYRHFSIEEGAVITGGYFSFPSADSSVTRKRVDDILLDRKGKHPLEYPSAGSVFKNPEGHSSWKLIDDAGLKGMSVGGAMVSEKHTNFIINTGRASARDVRDLIGLIQAAVLEKFSVSLETEIRMLGEF
jgi:UDP-N-acetylmuramate dehydrogenase